MSQNPEDLMGQAFGADIKRRRLAKGLGQEKLAGAAGTTRETIRHIENGHVPRLSLIYGLAEALDTNLWELLPQDRQGFQPGPAQEGVGGANDATSESLKNLSPRLDEALASTTGFAA